jgi:protease I
MTETEYRGKKILLVIAQEQFRDEECFVPKQLFEAAGAEVTVAAESTKTAIGTLGGSIKPDIRISDARIDDYDAIVISGGSGSKKYLWDNKALQKLVKEADAQKKIVSAICVSPVVSRERKAPFSRVRIRYRNLRSMELFIWIGMW